MFRSMYNLSTEPEILKIQKENAKIWNSIKIKNQTLLITRNANVEIEFEHNSPVLLQEFYPIRLKILNKEDFPIKDLKYVIFI